MKHIHIVAPYQSVAMRRMYEPLSNELKRLYEVTVSETPDDEADLNFHMPFHTLIGYEKKGLHAMAYTHCNVGAEAQLIDACERADLITCMSYTGREELIELGVDSSKIWVVYCASDYHAFKQKTIGIVGYPQPNGRKRESILLDLAWKYDVSPFSFMFVGSGWENIVSQLQSLGVVCGTFHAESDEKLRTFYHQCDLLLITGYREGGSLPILEAMSTGIPVLSPRFGYARDLLGEDSFYETVEDLYNKLDWYIEPFVLNHKVARAWSWQDYCAEYGYLFGNLLGESVDLYPERGLSRYKQVMDIIEETEASNIVEIGTWNGHRAMQMIQTAGKSHSMNDINYQGFDLFESQTGEQFRKELSKQGWDKAVVEKKLNATGASIELVAGNTIDTLYPELINAEKFLPDFIFVDGGHSEKTIENDGSISLLCLDANPNAVIVFDDYYHTGKPKGMGCNKFIDNLDRNVYEVVHLPTVTVTDTKTIGMVKVKKNGNLHLQMSHWSYSGTATLNEDKPEGDLLGVPV